LSPRGVQEGQEVTTTAWIYLNETVKLLVARAPGLRTAVRDAKKAGHAYVVLDGTLIPGGDILWVPGVLPGSVQDKTGGSGHPG
jgi:hypothetical protein